MKDFLYELGYIQNEDLDCIADSISYLKQRHNDIKITRLQDSDIDFLTKDSPTHLLRALYTCKPFVICKDNKQSFIAKENASEILGYKGDFANMFIYKKQRLKTSPISHTHLTLIKALKIA